MAEIVESNAQIQNMIEEEIKRQLQLRVSQAGKRMERELRSLFQNTIRNTPAYESLISGQLRDEFGLIAPDRKLGRIVRRWMSTIKVEVGRIKFSGDEAKSVITIRGVEGDWQDVLSLQEARQLTEKGQELEWLQWLLIEGDKVIIRDYHIELAQSDKKGRAGRYIMAPRGRWSVPSQYSGTANNNFVTQAIDSIEKKIESIVEENIKRFL